MNRWLGAVTLAGVIWAPPPAEAHRKRADPCGCHHQYGLKHCHPKLKSEKCEAPVAGKKAVPKTKQPVTRKL